MIVCPKCGFSVKNDDARFCGACGLKLQSIPAANIDARSTQTENLLPEPELPLPSLQLGDAPQPVHTEVLAPPAADVPEQGSSTQIQTKIVSLLHQQSDTTIELPMTQAVIHIGKPNDRVPPDINVSTFDNAEVVSRVHANIHVEGQSYYIEDAGSANGTFLNGTLLKPGSRHRLRPGDVVALGRGELVTFLFQ